MQAIDYKKKRRCDPIHDDDFFCEEADYECSVGGCGDRVLEGTQNIVCCEG